MENEIPLVVVTTTHLSDLVDSLAGKRVQVLSLMGPGVDPHGYKPDVPGLELACKSRLDRLPRLDARRSAWGRLSNRQTKGESSIAATSEIPQALAPLLERRGSEDGHMKIRMFGSRLKFGRFA